MTYINGTQCGLYIDLPAGGAPDGRVTFQLTRGEMPYTSVKIEDVVTALQGYPGLTISYEDPTPPFTETAEVGTVIQWTRFIGERVGGFTPGGHTERVVKVDTDKWLIGSAGHPTTDKYIQGYLDKKNTTHVVIYPKASK